MYNNNMGGVAPIQAFATVLHEMAKTQGYVTDTDIRDKFIIDAAVQQGFQLVGEGQNRLVFVDPRDPNYVYKVASKNEGRNDNIGEMYITYKIMKEYPHLADAFALTQIPANVGQNLTGVDGQTLYNALLQSSLHGLIIKQERIQCLKDVSASGKDAIERLTSPQIYNSYVELMRRIGEKFIIMDAHPKNPYQFGLKNGKLATLDYGYFRPIGDFYNQPMMNNKVKVDNFGIVCPVCASGHLVYMTPQIPSHYSGDARVEYVTGAQGGAEKYVCSGANGAVRCNHEEYVHDLAGRMAR